MELDISEPLTITQSTLKTFRRCRRKSFLKDVQSLSLKDKYKTIGVADIGTVYHKYLEYYYQDTDQTVEEVENRVFRSYKAAVEHLLQHNPTKALEYKNAIETAHIMFEGYVEWIGEESIDAGLTFIENEKIFKSPVLTIEISGKQIPFQFQGKIDLIAVDENYSNLPSIIDHKSVARFDDWDLRLYTEQIMFYEMLVQMDPKYPVLGPSYINWARRVKRTARAKPPFYERPRIYRINSKYETFTNQVTEILRAMLQTFDDVDYENDLKLYPSPTRDCTWDCDFVGICEMYDDGSAINEFVKEYYKTSKPFTPYYYEEGTDIAQTIIKEPNE